MNSVTVFVIQSALIALILNKSFGNSQMLQCDTKTGFLSQKLWPGTENFTTATNMNYKFFPLSLVSTPYEGCITVKVRAKHDAHVSLTHRPSDEKIKYEMVIGGWGNTRSIIRSHQGPGASIEHQVYEAHNIVSETEFREFSVSWEGGQVNAYEGSSTEPFLTHNNPDLFPINYVGISTCCGASGTWKFEEPKCPGIKKPLRIRCANPISTDLQGTSVSTYVNHQTQILQNLRDDWFMYNTSNIHNELLVLDYIKTVTETMTNAQNNHEHIMSFTTKTDQKDLDTYLESSLFRVIKETYYQMIITFINDQIKLTKATDMTADKAYRFLDITKNTTSYLFKVISASDDIKLALTQSKQIRSPIFELKLSSTQLPTLFKNFNQNVAVGSPIILNEDHDYLLTWAKGVIHLKDLKNDETILKYTEPNMFKVNYIAIDTKDNKEDICFVL